MIFVVVVVFVHEEYSKIVYRNLGRKTGGYIDPHCRDLPLHNKIILFHELLWEGSISKPGVFAF